MGSNLLRTIFGPIHSEGRSYPLCMLETFGQANGSVWRPAISVVVGMRCCASV